MLIHKIDELAKNVEEIHRKMIEPMADPSKTIEKYYKIRIHLTIFCRTWARA